MRCWLLLPVSWWNHRLSVAKELGWSFVFNGESAWMSLDVWCIWCIDLYRFVPKLLININYYLNAGFGRGFVVCVMICVVPPLLSNNHERNWNENWLTNMAGWKPNSLDFENGFNQQKTISDLLFIEHVATSFSVILPPATSIWCISKPRDSKVLTLAASDDVSAVCGDDGCDGSQLMQSGFGKTTKIQGGPDRRPEALKDLADRLVQAKQDVGNWGVFGWGCCVTFLLSWRSFGKKLFLWEKSWPRFQAMMSALFDSWWPKGIWNSDDGGMFYTTDRHTNCIQKWGPQMSV